MCSSDISNLDGRIFKTVIDTNGFEQLINFPTRFDINHNRSSCIDFIITNEKRFITNIHSFGPIANSDHIPVAFSIDTKIPKLGCYKDMFGISKGGILIN